MADAMERLRRLEADYAALQEEVRAIYEVLEIQREMLKHLVAMANIQGEFMKDIRTILH